MNVAVARGSAADDAGVRQLLRTQAMPGRVRLSFCREPDFSLGCAVTGDEYQIVVARSQPGDAIVGVACRSVRSVFLNGRERRIGYLGQLRVDDRYRGRWLVSRGFATLGEMHRADPVPAYLASIVDGNEEATAILVRKPRRGFPQFVEAARYVTLALRVQRWRWPLGQPYSRWRRCFGQLGGQPTLDEIAEFLQREGARRQLNSVWTAERLRALHAFGLRETDIRVVCRDGAIAGVMALWDQSAYKQSVIRGYAGWLRAAAPLLPRPGTKLRSAYAALVCIANDDADVFATLLRDIYRRAAERDFEYLLVGLDARDPLLATARRYSHIAYPSRLYLATWPHGGPSHEPLDARPAYVDIATL